MSEYTPDHIGYAPTTAERCLIALFIGAMVGLFGMVLFYALTDSDNGRSFTQRCDDKGGIAVTYHHAKSTEDMCFRRSDEIEIEVGR